MSCFTCRHNQPAGCAISMPEYETFTDCPKHELEPGIHVADALMSIFGFERVTKEKGESDVEA